MSTSSPFSLHEKVILVTGAGGGLGRQFAMTLASAGASIACLDRDVRGASETVSAIQRSSGVADVYIADVSEENILNDAVQSIIKTFGRIDVLVNNAGISTRPVRIHELPTTDWDRVMSINLRGTYLCAKVVLPYMMEKGGGSIINIASITGIVGFYPGASAISAAYSASKGGMASFTRQLAAEYAADNIRCNAVAPGFHSGTELGEERRAFASISETQLLNDAILRRTPFRRLGSPNELAGLVHYLSSDASLFITGQLIAHDGGWTAA